MDEKKNQHDLKEIMWAEMIVSYTLILFHSLMYATVVTDPWWSFSFPVMHAVAICLYLFIFYLWHSNRIKTESYVLSQYFQYVSSETIEDFFFTIWPVISIHIWVMSFGFFIWDYEMTSYFPHYSIGAVAMMFSIIVSVKKPVRIQQIIDAESKRAHHQQQSVDDGGVKNLPSTMQKRLTPTNKKK